MGPRYRRSSMTTSTSHGRTVPLFFGSCVFLLRIVSRCSFRVSILDP